MKAKKSPSPLDILSGKSNKKDDEKDKKAGHKGGKHKRTIIDHHLDGSHTNTHEPRDGGDPVSYARTDLAGSIAGLKENLGPEAEAGAEPSPALSPVPMR